MVPYAFVDVDRIKSVRGVYVATQLTPGPVGRRHLLSLITYNRGGRWQRIRSPTVDNRGVRINCYLASIPVLIIVVFVCLTRTSGQHHCQNFTDVSVLLNLDVTKTFICLGVFS